MLDSRFTLRGHGFSLIELLVSLAILALLASVAMPLAEMTVQREKERALKRALWEIRDALDGYRRAREAGAILTSLEKSPFPPSLKTLTEPIADSRVGHAGEILKFLRTIPRDPFADNAVSAEASWGIRSYQSEASDPKPGDDVYDVYSKSDLTGLNGVPLRKW